MSETLALGERFRWLAFFVQHANLVPALLGLFQEWQAATTVDAKAEVIKSLIDLLKGVVADLPVGTGALLDGDVQALVADETDSLELRLGNGELLKKLMENLPQIIQLIGLLKPLLG